MNARISVTEVSAVAAAIAPSCATDLSSKFVTTSTARNRKRESRTWPVIRLGPEAAMMSLDDRAADGQPDTHTAALGCVEGFEQLREVLRIDTGPRILHAETHPI